MVPPAAEILTVLRGRRLCGWRAAVEPDGRLVVTSTVRPVFAAEGMRHHDGRQITGAARARQGGFRAGQPAEPVGLLAAFTRNGVLAAVEEQDGAGVGVEDIHLSG